jgi:hypothetical protein
MDGLVGLSSSLGPGSSSETTLLIGTRSSGGLIFGEIVLAQGRCLLVEIHEHEHDGQCSLVDEIAWTEGWFTALVD